MIFSIILATLNREKEIVRCLQSLRNQIEKDFEIIIVDQSDNTGTEIAAKGFSDLQIKYFNVNFKGLSKARNYGMKYAKGEYLCLVDDDAEYKSDYLSNAVKLIADNANVILSGIILSNSDHKTPFIDCSKMDDHEVMTTRELIKYAPSASLIFPRTLYEQIGDFDERLGVGNIYAAGEETDYLLRAKDKGFNIIHCKNIVAYHPIKNNSYNRDGVVHHAMGKGALFKIDSIERKNYRLLGYAIRNTVGMLIKTIINSEKKRKFYYWRLKGFILGYKTFKTMRAE